MNIPTHFHDHWRGKRDKSCNRVLRTDFAAMVYNKIGLRSISPAPIAMATSPMGDSTRTDTPRRLAQPALYKARISD